MDSGKVPPHSITVRCAPGENGRTRWGTDPARRITLGEPRTLRSQLVQVRALNQRMPIGRRIPPPHIVSEKDHNIRAGLFRLYGMHD